jgi:hypothetical protein
LTSFLLITAEFDHLFQFTVTVDMAHAPSARPLAVLSLRPREAATLWYFRADKLPDVQAASVRQDFPALLRPSREESATMNTPTMDWERVRAALIGARSVGIASDLVYVEAADQARLGSILGALDLCKSLGFRPMLRMQTGQVDEGAKAPRWGSPLGAMVPPEPYFLDELQGAIEAYHRQQAATLRSTKALTPTERTLRAKEVDLMHTLLLASAPKLAKELSREDIPGSIDQRQAAFRLFQEGKLFEGIATLDQLELFRLRSEWEYQRAATEEWHARLARYFAKQALEHLEADRGEKAKRLLLRALEIQRCLAARHPDLINPEYNKTFPDLARTLHALGVLHLDRDRTGKARQFLEEALAIHRTMATVDSYHRQQHAMASTLADLADLYRSQHDEKRAQHASDEAQDLARY